MLREPDVERAPPLLVGRARQLDAVAVDLDHDRAAGVAEEPGLRARRAVSTRPRRRGRRGRAGLGADALRAGRCVRVRTTGSSCAPEPPSAAARPASRGPRDPLPALRRLGGGRPSPRHSLAHAAEDSSAARPCHQRLGRTRTPPSSSSCVARSDRTTLLRTRGSSASSSARTTPCAVAWLALARVVDPQRHPATRRNIRGSGVLCVHTYREADRARRGARPAPMPLLSSEKRGGGTGA